MKLNLRRFALVAVVAVALLAATGANAHAQPRPIVVPPVGLQAVNTNYYLNPYMSLNQYAYNAAVIGQAYRQLPPQYFGYNPRYTAGNGMPIAPYYNFYRPAYGYGYGYNPYAAGFGYYP
jgi:hypothetical protein